MRSNMELRKNKILNFLTISLLAGYYFNAVTAFASSSEACTHQEINESNYLCEQNARHLALENNMKILTTFLHRSFDVAEEPTFREVDLIKTTYIKNYSSNTLKSAISKPLDFDVWPRPKTLNRYFEKAIASLDLKGKEDLKYCVSIKNATLLPENSKVSAHQLNAAITFSENQLPNSPHSNPTVVREHSVNDCRQLFTLILG